MFTLSSERRRDFFALLAYLLLALVLTYPLILRFSTHVAGDGSDDPALAWNLWWVRYAIFDLGRSPIYTDYMFYPIGLNLAFYTLTYLNAFVSIPIQFAFSLIPAANVNLILSFTLSGFGAYLLVKYLLRTQPSALAPFAPFAAFASGLVYAFSANKFLYASLGQFNIASSQWIPFYILFLLKTFPLDGRSVRQPPTHPLRNGLLLGLFLLFQALSEFIFASFLILFTLAYLLYWLIANRFQIRNPQSAVCNSLVASLVFLLPMSPLLAALLADMQAEGDFIQQGLGFSNSFSADLVGFFIPSHLHPLFGGLESQFHFAYINFSYLGYVALALALIALWKVKPARLWGIWFALVFLITLGPTLRVNGNEFDAPFLPFNLLLQIPFIKGNRYPSRWSVMLTLCLAVLVGYGLMWVLPRIANRISRIAYRQPPSANRLSPRGYRLSAIGYPLFAICYLLILFEHLSVPLPLSDLRVPSVYETSARDAERGNFTVMELPLAWRNGFRVTGSYRADSQAPIDRIFMLAQWYQTAQQHPILNGNTSRNPELKFQYFAEAPLLDSLIAIQTGHAVDDTTRARDKELAPRVLRFFGTRYVVWHTPYEEANRAVAQETRAYVEAIFPLTKIAESYENGRGVVAYRVKDFEPSDSITLEPDDPLARLYLGEGWGAVGGDAFWATRRETKLFLPLSATQNIRLTLHDIVPFPSNDQGIAIQVNGKTIVHHRPIPISNGDFDAAIPASELRVGMNEIILAFDNMIPITRLPNYPTALVVRSAGEEQGDFGHIYINGVDESPNARGYNLVVIDPQTGKVETRANFDTFASEENSARLAEFIARIPDGKLVAVAARDEASFHLTADAVSALESLGARADLRGKFRWSHALVGVKGAPAGSAREAASATHVSQLILGLGATEPNIAARIGALRVEPSP